MHRGRARVQATVDALIEACPELASRVKDPRSRDSGKPQLMKEFPGGVLILTGANSAVGLRSMSVRYLFLDENAVTDNPLVLFDDRVVSGGNFHAELGV